jgi:hypothetical protein
MDISIRACSKYKYLLRSSQRRATETDSGFLR